MSRIGQQPITLPSQVTVTLEGNRLTAKGAKGESSVEIPARVKVAVKDGVVEVTRANDEKLSRSLHGTVRSLIANAVLGVSEGYQKDLQIEGVGFRAAVQGQKLVLNVGFSHPIEYAIPEGLAIVTPSQTEIQVTGVNKQQVGEAAARIRGFCPAEPYKGKGIRYKGEHIRRKVGKAVA